MNLFKRVSVLTHPGWTKWVLMGLGGLFVVALILLGALLFMNQQPVPLDTQVSQPSQVQPSYYEILAKEVQAHPTTPISDQILPDVVIGETDSGGPLIWAAGGGDMIFPEDKVSKTGQRKIATLLNAMNKGDIKDWWVVEANLKDVRYASNLSPTLSHPNTPKAITTEAQQVFMDVAKHSRDYNAIKWAITLADMGETELTAQQWDVLMTLARHSELTAAVANNIVADAEAVPQYYNKLLAMLPVSKQWGLYHVITYIIDEHPGLKNLALQRELVLTTARYEDGLMMEIAFPLFKAVDMPALFKVAENDPALFKALAVLMESIMLEPNRYASLTEYGHAAQTVDNYLTLIDHQPPSIYRVLATDDVRFYVDSHPKDFENDKILKNHLNKTYSENAINADWLKKGLKEGLKHGEGDPVVLSNTLTVISRRRMHEMAPDVEALYNQTRNLEALKVLLYVGDESHLQRLVEALPERVNIEHRKKQPFYDKDMGTLKPAYDTLNSPEYEYVILEVGRLKNETAQAAIKTALKDYVPMVRYNAVISARDLPPNLVDSELIDLLKARQKDKVELVASEAELTLKKLQ